METCLISVSSTLAKESLRRDSISRVDGFNAIKRAGVGAVDPEGLLGLLGERFPNFDLLINVPDDDRGKVGMGRRALLDVDTMGWAK